MHTLCQLEVMILINIWKYQDADKVIITDIDNKMYIGNVVEVIDAEEKSDIEKSEDSIVIDISGTHIEFLQSEIKVISSV